MRKNLCLAWLLLLISTLSIQGQQPLSDNSRISILTCAPGEELYSVFGHSAIRVQDSINNLDIVFNYGTFDFDTPNFYLKFAQGNLDYLLTISRYKYFCQQYIVEERTITEQELNLNPVERQKLFDKLITNSQPENRAYRYDFLFDNCATRIRDQILNSTDEGKIAITDEKGVGLSYRALYGSYLKHSPWVEFGIHLLLGAKTDKIANGYAEMYLPDYLYDQFKGAKIQKASNQTIDLVKSNEVLVDFPRPTSAKNKLFWPSSILLIYLFFIAGMTFFLVFKQRRFKFINVLLFLPSALLGILLIFLWFFTRHSVTVNNFNLLWANPVNLVLLVLLYMPNISSTLIKYVVLFLIACNLFFLVAFICNWQAFPEGLVYLVMAMTVYESGIAYLFWFKKEKLLTKE